MLEDSFTEVYTKFKLHFYQEIFSAFQDQEAGLSAMETFCMEVILALNEPTVNEFASFVRISSPNAAYKINSLLQKGYLEKRQSSSDRREYHLRPTEKYMRRFNDLDPYGKIYAPLQRQQLVFTVGAGPGQTPLQPRGCPAAGPYAVHCGTGADAGSGTAVSSPETPGGVCFWSASPSR